ncbi:carbamoyl-phosphate synthase large subunit [Vallitalea okinawensis]|uniref:carbamoyl-phosphate synthase large subunit n=1 Tax=Vallitalea okinawensis TaxID=2078660 RepID=UPI000CFCB3C3|nr:carbamoyl-phosphate synthase large subunit [Vallitalea okinawensis]
MPLRNDINKVLVIGSGPILIGQGAEFDYAGTQACKALKELGIEVILVNSNPATIMTDDHIADKVYIQPLTVEALTWIIKSEKPDGLLATLGGQTGLNMAIKLKEAGVLEEYKVTPLGTSIDTIKKAEDRESFKELMLAIKEPVVKSEIVSTVEDALIFAKQIGYPVVVRPAFTLGGTGGGIAENEEVLRSIANRGLLYSPIDQILVEQSIAGWKEIEYEVMRDGNDTCIIVCNMENMDPVGIHTGDSIVVAPSQTLSDNEYHMLRTSAIKIIKALNIEGGCNVQYALHPDTAEYFVIEVNPRVSRSSALASKATGYPIAKISAQIAAGLHLHEIINPVTGKTVAAFEPTLDYIVTKIPKLPFDKFNYADRSLGTQMQATGEVMAIDRSFESSLLKALISLEGGCIGLRDESLSQLSDNEVFKKLHEPNDQRIFVIAECLRRDFTPIDLADITMIDMWFINKINNIILMEKRLANEVLNMDLLKACEKMGFTDQEILELSRVSKTKIDTLRRVNNIYPVYKIVDTCAAEFEAKTPYYYSSYDEEDENNISLNEKIIVIGSGPIRIGQGIEFDYASVHAAWAIEELGFESIMINNNPETVSTDFDTSNKLYFEPLYFEDVLNIVRAEVPKGVILQFGGQTAINLAEKLMKKGVQVLGTSVEAIHLAEDRKQFDSLLEELNIPKPDGMSVITYQGAAMVAKELGYPLLVRPSFVIGGRAMQVVNNEIELKTYVEEAVNLSSEHPILVDKYIEGIEVEIDAICDGENILIPGIMEHIERTGVHSGDSMCVYPQQTINQAAISKIIDYTSKLANALQIKGLMNIQFVIANDQVYIIEVNPRASRTVPIISKVTKVPMVKLAIATILGHKLTSLGYGTGLYPSSQLIAVKAPVFSFHKLKQVDIALTPEMKSTGEVLGVDSNYEKALLKAFIGAGYPIIKEGNVLISLTKNRYEECLPLIEKLIVSGFNLLATEGTYEFINQKGYPALKVEKDEVEALQHMLQEGKVQMLFNLPTAGRQPERSGFKLRETANSFGIPCFTCLDTIEAYLTAIQQEAKVLTYNEIKAYM